MKYLFLLTFFLYFGCKRSELIEVNDNLTFCPIKWMGNYEEVSSTLVLNDTTSYPENRASATIENGVLSIHANINPYAQLYFIPIQTPISQYDRRGLVLGDNQPDVDFEMSLEVEWISYPDFPTDTRICLFLENSFTPVFFGQFTPRYSILIERNNVGYQIKTSFDEQYEILASNIQDASSVKLHLSRKNNDLILAADVFKQNGSTVEWLISREKIVPWHNELKLIPALMLKRPNLNPQLISKNVRVNVTAFHYSDSNPAADLIFSDEFDCNTLFHR